MTDAAARRLRLRAWRRGTKEMDLILGPFVAARVEAMDAPARARLEALMEENDQDLYLWVTGARPPPETHAALIDQIADFARARLSPRREDPPR